MLRDVAELAGERQIVGLAPSASAARVLEGEADIPARTLQWFLTRYRDVGDGIAPPEKTGEARKALGGSVLILNEASMVGTIQMRNFASGSNRMGKAACATRSGNLTLDMETVEAVGGRCGLRRWVRFGEDIRSVCHV